ncbi:MAG: hypothetical protein A2Y41_07050 [Spirochaetes bacterium GWB1_36_13]|nr:MAG: hypothetical protein A2Y41_07050 [Spirochaetes bacterium GWB1_36_13]
MRAKFYLSASIMSFILVSALFILSFFYDQLFPLIVFGVVFILIFFLNSWIFSRRISFSVNRLLKGIKELSSGNFQFLSETKNHDEFGKLEKNLNQYILNTKNMIQNIYRQSYEIFSSLREFSENNQELSGKIDSQASALEETVSAIYSLSENVRENSSNSHTAKNIARETEGTATEGENSIHQTVSSMKEIIGETSKIKDVVRIIETISFQTNILALNAAVEAARAKEHGKGFAVVANEVRNLAQKSGENAKNISLMIEKIIRVIENGNQFSLESESKFLKIKEQINNTAKVIEEVAQSSSEQAEGVEQISQAVSHIDQLIQNNTFQVNENLDVASNLEEKAKTILEILRNFQIDHFEHEEFSVRKNKILEQDILVSWNSGYSVKVEELDAHHKKLISLMNALHQALKEGKTRSVLSKIIRELIQYTQFHFGKEEELMKKNGYPDFTAHKKQHDKFVEKISEAQNQFENNEAENLSAGLLTFLKDWLVNHIMIIDKKYSHFFNKKGIQ